MIDFLSFLVIASPIVTLLILSATGLIQQPLPSIAVDRITKANVTIGLLASFGILAWMLWTGNRVRILDLGNLVDIDEEHLHFHLEFIFDRLSLPMIIMTFVLVGVIGSFANIYLQADAGYHRFFICFSVFLVGLIFAFLAGTIETLFLGWELVGLSSALLIAYFHERPAPVQNGLRVWAVYRVSDAAFLAAAIFMHHQIGEGEFSRMTGSSAWPDGVSALEPWTSFLVGVLLLVAAAGKSGLIPFSGWLPRAMEGPTPSSAVFYGALSIHLGAYLLLRVSPILAESVMLRVLIVALGAITAIVAAAVSRVQTDVKSALAYSSVCQVSIIVMEIGFGLWYLALIHMIGHAFLRSLQLLRAPTLLRDYRSLENAIGGRLAHHPEIELSQSASPSEQRWYRFALERGYMDAMIDLYVVRPFVECFRFFERLENRWMEFLEGNAPWVASGDREAAKPVGDTDAALISGTGTHRS
jgi:NAD(P)H-quinone oxidoreductase subunit 5